MTFAIQVYTYLMYSYITKKSSHTKQIKFYTHIFIKHNQTYQRLEYTKLLSYMNE